VVDYPNNAPAGSSQANTAMPGYGQPLRTNFSYAAGLADAVRNAASFLGNVFSFGTLGGSSPSTSSSPTAAPTATTSPTSTTTPGATTPREAAAARTPPTPTTYQPVGGAGVAPKPTTAAAPVATGTTAPTEKPGASAMSAMGYAAGLGVSPPSSGIGAATAPVDVSNFTDTKFGTATDFTSVPVAATAPVPGEGVEAAHQAISATPKTGTAAPPARVTYNLDPKTAAAGGTTTTMAAEKPIVTDALSAISAAAPGFGLDRIEVTGGGGVGGGHVSHKYGTEMDIVGYNADGSPWTDEQRVQIANVAAAQGAGRFGLYPGGALHFGFSEVNPHAAWGPGGKTSGVPASAFPQGERDFATWAKSGQPYSAYQGGSRFSGVPGAVDPFAGSTTYGAGGPATGGNFERDPNGNPVPPASIPGGLNIPPGAPVGMENKNPVNIKWSGSEFQKSYAPGAVGPSKNLDPGTGGKGPGTPQVVFESQEAGMDAAVALAQHRFNENGLNTVNKLITDADFGWTPGSQAAAEHVAQIMKVGVDDPINLNDPATMQRYMRALITQEQGDAGMAYGDDFISASVDRKLGGGAAGAANAQATGGPMPAAPGGADFSIPGAGFGQPEAYAAPAAPAAAKPAAPAAATTAATGKQPSLKIGASGPAVRDLQTQLAAAGFNPGAFDGKFGPQTKAALVAFQRANPGAGGRSGRPDAIAGPRTQAALPAANPYRDIQPPEDIVVQPPGGYAAGLTPTAFNERFGPTPAPAAAAPPPSAGPNFDETFNAPTPLPGQELTPEQGAGTMATRGDLRDRLPSAAATAGAGYYRGLQSVEEDRASRARIPETIAATYAAITGGGGIDQFAGGPTGGIPAPAPDFSTNPAAVGANIGAAGAAAPPVSSGYVPTPYRDPGLVSPDEAARARADFERLKGGAGTTALGGGAGEDQLREPGPGNLYPGEWPLSGAAKASSQTVPGTIQREPELNLPPEGPRPAPMRQLLDRGIGRQAMFVGQPPQGPFNTGRERLKGAMDKTVPGGPPGPELQRPMEDLRTRPDGTPDAPDRVIADAGAAALTAPEPDVVRTLASLPPEGQAQYRGAFVNNIIDSIDQAGDARGILKAIDASPQASRRLEVVLGPQGASQFKSLVRVDGIGNREPGTRFAAALPSMAGLRGSPPVDSQVAARVGALLDSNDPAEFSRGLKIVANNPNLTALVQRVDAMV
jgi:peptidoglycan hydrolase-like protein with peptidoglycan-binding domain